MSAVKTEDSLNGERNKGEMGVTGGEGWDYR